MECIQVISRVVPSLIPSFYPTLPSSHHLPSASMSPLITAQTQSCGINHNTSNDVILTQGFLEVNGWVESLCHAPVVRGMCWYSQRKSVTIYPTLKGDCGEQINLCITANSNHTVLQHKYYLSPEILTQYEVHSPYKEVNRAYSYWHGGEPDIWPACPDAFSPSEVTRTRNCLPDWVESGKFNSNCD